MAHNINDENTKGNILKVIGSSMNEQELSMTASKMGSTQTDDKNNIQNEEGGKYQLIYVLNVSWHSSESLPHD